MSCLDKYPIPTYIWPSSSPSGSHPNHKIRSIIARLVYSLSVHLVSTVLTPSGVVSNFVRHTAKKRRMCLSPILNVNLLYVLFCVGGRLIRLHLGSTRLGEIRRSTRATLGRTRSHSKLGRYRPALVVGMRDPPQIFGRYVHTTASVVGLKHDSHVWPLP